MQNYLQPCKLEFANFDFLTRAIQKLLRSIIFIHLLLVTQFKAKQVASIIYLSLEQDIHALLMKQHMIIRI